MDRNVIERVDDSMFRLDKKRHNRFEYRYQVPGYLMLLPTFVILTIFVIVPLVMAIFRAFQDYPDKVFIGFDNFITLFSSQYFLKSFKNVLIMAVAATLLTVLTSFIFALALKTLNNKLSNVAKVIVYVPTFISGVAITIMFGLITNYSGGLITSILASLDMEPINFSDNVFLARVSIIIPSVWVAFGGNTLIMYAGLINIPKSYYEAASIDGANAWVKLWKITIPCMKNYFLLQLVSLMTANIQMLDLPLLITGGGPLNETLTPTLYIYNIYSSPSFSPNIAIAGALVIMVLIGSINWIIFRLVSSRRSEDA